MSDLRLAAIGFRRFGLGARVGDLDARQSDIRDTLLVELDGGVPEPGPAGTRDTAAILVSLRERFVAAKEQMAAGGRKPGEAGVASPGPDPLSPVGIFRAEAAARFRLATAARTGFTERLVAFWANHFAVSAGRSGPVRSIAGSFEREAIRPHLFGRFAEMLVAVETHPAMLMYLDNVVSIGPSSRAGARRGRGLNENLAREVLELHTVGVGGGYSQADVTSLARILTGWTVLPQDDRHGPPGTAVFNESLHEPGAHMVLGVSYRDEGPDQARRVLRALAARPETARHLATKLVRHFIADDPAPAMVAKLARVFMETGGDLRAVTRALVEAPEAWSADAPKIRSPQEFLLATHRLLGPVTEFAGYLRDLQTLGQPPWTPPGPNGFPDTVAHWATPEGLQTRLELAGRIGRRSGDLAPAELLDAALGPLASAKTREAVTRAGDRGQAVAILLMSPEFQRR